jgi:hypothetical protein
MKNYFIKNKINRQLSKLTFNTYFPEIPLKAISAILESFGIETSFLDGIYCGNTGETVEQIPGTKLYFLMTWYKMASGNYEITCYVS